MDFDIEDISSNIDVSDRDSQVLSRDRALVFPKARNSHAEDVDDAIHAVPGSFAIPLFLSNYTVVSNK
jgi:hypothetical protein